MAEANPPLDALLARKAELVAELGRVNRAIDGYRVKCSTCRCRILPGRDCPCCAGSLETDGDEQGERLVESLEKATASMLDAAGVKVEKP